MKPCWQVVGAGIAFLNVGVVVHLCGVAWGKNILDLANFMATLILTTGTFLTVAGLFGIKLGPEVL